MAFLSNPTLEERMMNHNVYESGQCWHTNHRTSKQFCVFNVYYGERQ
jgi:hypothetical protein